MSLHLVTPDTSLKKHFDEAEDNPEFVIPGNEPSFEELTDREVREILGDHEVSEKLKTKLTVAAERMLMLRQAIEEGRGYPMDEEEFSRFKHENSDLTEIRYEILDKAREQNQED